MSGKIKLKRGNSANFGALILEQGEPAFTLDTGKLYVGNGTDKILINPDTAKKLETSRSITLTGDTTGNVNFDGSANVSITTTLANSGVTAGSGYGIVNVDAKGRVTSGRAMTATDIPNLTLAKITDSGTCANKNVGISAGQVPLLNSSGKLEDSIIPKVAIVDTFVVNTQTAMLALTAEVGDVVVRTDLSKSFILKATGASVLANWQELLTPTDKVTSVAGRTGVVTLTANDVGLGNVTNESKATMFTNANLTGSPTAPTQTVADSSTKIATTAWVKSQGFLTSGTLGDIDGGIF